MQLQTHSAWLRPLLDKPYRFIWKHIDTKKCMKYQHKRSRGGQGAQKKAGTEPPEEKIQNYGLNTAFTYIQNTKPCARNRLNKQWKNQERETDKDDTIKKTQTWIHTKKLTTYDVSIGVQTQHCTITHQGNITSAQSSAATHVTNIANYGQEKTFNYKHKFS